MLFLDEDFKLVLLICVIRMMVVLLYSINVFYGLLGGKIVLGIRFVIVVWRVIEGVCGNCLKY